MFFFLSKTVAFLLLPSNFLAAMTLAGFILMATPWRRAGRRLAATGFVLLLLVGFLPVGHVLSHALENRFPRWNPARGAPDGIVVLGGVIDPMLSRTRRQVSLSESAERVTVIAKLAHDYPNARIVFSSGDAGLLSKDGAEAHYLYPLLDTFGVPRARVTLEDHARNTAENAAFTKALVKPKPGERWLLVTSAQHMPRAVGCFRRVGFPVEAYPVDYDTPPRMKLRPSTQFGRGLDKADTAVHEWLGLVVYWLTGRTGELLPAPANAK
jgi:uncharacterized SAM-binding protein YcdF (DUF218 family)